MTFPEESKDRRQSLSFRLSEKVQASLDANRDKDEDFRPDRKRIRTAEHQVTTGHRSLSVIINFDLDTLKKGPKAGSSGPLSSFFTCDAVAN